MITFPITSMYHSLKKSAFHSLRKIFKHLLKYFTSFIKNKTKKKILIFHNRNTSFNSGFELLPGVCSLLSRCVQIVLYRLLKRFSLLRDTYLYSICLYKLTCCLLSFHSSLEKSFVLCFDYQTIRRICCLALALIH